MTHRIGVIGGDGIGPEVVAEALKVIDADRRRRTSAPTTTWVRTATCEDGTVLPDEVLEEWRGLDALLLGAVGDPAVGRVGAGRAGRARDPAAHALRAGPVHQPAAVPAAATLRLRGDPREHRGHLRRRGWVPAQGHPARDRHAGLGQHPHGRGALRPVRLRDGGAAPSAGT